MEDYKKIIVAIVIIGILAMISPEGLQLTGRHISGEEYRSGSYGCYVQRHYGPCWELGNNWEEDPKNPGWCRNCGYT